MNSGIVRTGRQYDLIPPQAGSNIGHSAGLLARLFLVKLVRGHTIGDALVRRHAAYCEPLALERHEPAMVHGRVALEFEHLPALRVDFE
jgi:hypothetical protein